MSDGSTAILSDSASDLNISGEIGEFVVRDSVVNINLETKGGRRKADEMFHDYRRQLRTLRTKPGKKTVKELDALIIDLNELAQSFIQLGSTSIAAQYMALMARGQFMRGKVDEMWKSSETALSLDPNCEFALLHLGEFHGNIARRLREQELAREEWTRSARYLRVCRENGETDGARNNAGFQLCQALIGLGEMDEAKEVKQWLEQRVTNEERLKQIGDLPV